jgi:hypothetical protein
MYEFEYPLQRIFFSILGSVMDKSQIHDLRVIPIENGHAANHHLNMPY